MAHPDEDLANLGSFLEHSAASRPGHPAIRLDDFVLSYADLRGAAGQMSTLLSAAGVEPGDRVGIMLPNVPAFPIAFYGALAAGAVVVPMNPLFKSREIGYYLGDSGARVLLAWHTAAGEAAKGAADAGAQVLVAETADLADLLAGHASAAESSGRGGEDDAVILYTSGTTGKPKGAQLTHANMTSNADLVTRTLLQNGTDDVTMGCLPLFHVFGLTCGLNATVAAGGTLTLLPRFDGAKALEIIQRDAVTIFEGVPTMYAAMLHSPDGDPAQTATLRTCISGGASLPLEILRGFEEKFDCVILEGYGLSETSPVASFNLPDRPRKPGSIGVPVEGVQMRLVDDLGQPSPEGEIGEIAIKGPTPADVARLDSAIAAVPFRDLPMIDRPYLDAAGALARAGNAEKARAMVTRYRSEMTDTSIRRVQEPELHRTLAEIALAEGKPLDAVTEFRRGDVAYDGGPVDECAPCLPFDLARAYDAAGKPDSAALFFEQYLSTPYWRKPESDMDPIRLPAIRERLGQLYEALGKPEKAGQQYRAFIELWKNADPELQPRVADARRRLAKLAPVEKSHP